MLCRTVLCEGRKTQTAINKRYETSLSMVEVRLMRRTSSSGSMRCRRFSELKELLNQQILSTPLTLLKAAPAPLLMPTWRG